MTLSVRNWRKFQHYKDRRPPWIKLHADLLMQPEWHSLTGDEAKLLVELWLVAADLSLDGSIDLDVPALAFRLRRDSTMLARGIKSLCDKGLLDCASTVLASAAPETETEAERETEQKTHVLNGGSDDQTKSSRPDPNGEYSPDFVKLWRIHPRGGKRTAYKAFLKAIPSKITLAEAETFLRGYRDGFSNGFKGAHLSTWLNGEQWEEIRELHPQHGKPRQPAGFYR